MALSSNRYVWRFLTLISLIFAFLCAVLFYFQDIFIVLIIGAILILVTEKFLFFYNRIMDRFPDLNRRVVGIGLLSFALLALVFLVGSQMPEIEILITESTKVQEDYLSGASELFGKDSALSGLVDSGVLKPEDLKRIGNDIFTELTGTISKLSYYLFAGILIIPLMCGMYFRNRHKLRNYIHEIAPPKYAEGIVRALEGIGRKLEDFFTAKMIESSVVGLICCIGFYLVGIDGWLFLGILSGFLNIIPYIGPIIGAIPPIIVGYINSPETAFFAAVTVFIAQLVDNLYLIPFMISEKVNINPLLSVLLTLSASKLLGALGMVLAIPLFIIYKTIISEAYEELVKIYPEKE